MIKDIFPPVETFIEMEPEEAGQYLLMYLNNHVKNNQNRNQLYKSHFLNSSQSEVRDYSGSQIEKVLRVMAEAWGWLEREGFLAPFAEAAGSEGWFSISRRGEKIQSPADFKKFKHIELLPKNLLDPVLAQKVWPVFVSGEFDTAVFAAFKEVEVRLRSKAELPHTELGVSMARKALNPSTGVLTDKDNPDMGERTANMELFAGALGSFKNPGSHRDVDFDDPVTVVELIMFANLLLSIIDKRTVGP